MKSNRFLVRLVSTPPHVIARKASQKIQAELKYLSLRVKDRRVPTYSGTSKGRLNSCLDVAVEVLPAAGVSATLAARYCEHSFNLLGSGWQSVHHGVACRGMEGVRFAAQQPMV